MKERVLVAMSGGVDSSVAAAILAEEGYDVVGATMKLFCHGDDLPDRPCCSLDSVNDARRICQQLGVPLERRPPRTRQFGLAAPPAIVRRGHRRLVQLGHVRRHREPAPSRRGRRKK